MIANTIRATLGRRTFHAAAPRLTGKTIESTAETFEKLVLKADHPVIVDFYADWCGPCKILQPMLSKAVAANPAVTLVTLNVDDNMDIASKYKIASLPTVAAFHNGEITDQFIGVRKGEPLNEFVKKHAQLV